ncbi:DUF2092 domain-containing protein [Nordella sp. HKS 07]|uniref:DUF2092 domain-containing protein n=1 Tax=Nordella sp. HKS 07 TaxID=2712222 RepID=UPI0013E1459E|nr:DUF2092 domain-containing protein [Nordella sp. HKS 07]QIG46823.1 DUF2092 domain-containing protein [Nordella sp. HKS 07]
MNIRHLLDPEQVRLARRRKGGLTAARHVLAAVTLTVGVAALSVPAWAQTEDELAKQYKIESMKQALETKERYDLYGLRFASDQSAVPADAQSLLDDIAATLKNFPEWHLRIVGHTDATADPQHNQALSLDRANAIKAGLVERGVDEQRLATAGAGESRPLAGNDTPEGRALNRRVELIRFTDSAEAKRLLKAMSDYLDAQKAISFDYDAALEVVTNDKQKLALSSSGMVTLNRPDKIRAARAGGFVDVETLFDGKTLTVLGKNANKYTQLEVPGTIDHLIDELRTKYDRPLPAADLLGTNAYAALMEDVYDSKDLGSGVINGTECDFLAFRKDEVDLQVWIAHGDSPYPCKYVLTSRLVTDGPQYSVEIRNWSTGDKAMKDDFAFQNATNAEKIDLKDLQDKTSELPSNFAMGGKQ